MATLKELRDERLRKINELRKLGVNPYPATSNRDHYVAEVLSSYKTLESNQKTVTVAGRITNIRKFGKIAFVVIRDVQDSIQLFLSEDTVKAPDFAKSELAFSNLNLFDSGDFIEVTGVAATTKTGEKSITVEKLRLLTKSLRPMPTAQDGFTNKEERLRRRYVDMNVNKDVYERFVRRSKFWKATRDFLNNDDFLEINIPVLEHTTGGADANPFVTHMDAIDQDFYLRISHELPLKRLIGGGYEKVYDLGPRFRNENYTDEHLPEHIAMEWYAAYWDWQKGMKFMTEMYRYVVKETFGTLKFKLGKFDVDLSKDWEQWDYAETIHKKYGIDVFKCTLDEVKEALKDHKLEVEQTENKARGIDKLWKNIRKDVTGPIWLINTPTFISPLSKTNPDNANTVQRFQPIIAGSELGNGFSELNDPLDQLDRFLEQQNMRDEGDDEAMMLDIDFIEMLEYGMPPACGWGYSERVFWIFEGVTAREGVPFPQLRTEIDEVTKSIYPEVYATEKTDKNSSKSRSQDFSKRIVTVVNKDLEPWQVANAVAHMDAIIGNELPKDQLTSGDHFKAKDGAIPRNSQYPIIIMRSDEKTLHKIYDKIKTAKLIHHVFIKEMQDTTDDQEIDLALDAKTLADTTFYGVSFFADHKLADELTSGLQLWK